MRGCLAWIGVNLLVFTIGSAIAVAIGRESGVGWFILGAVVAFCVFSAYEEYRGRQS